MNEIYLGLYFLDIIRSFVILVIGLGIPFSQNKSNVNKSLLIILGGFLVILTMDKLNDTFLVNLTIQVLLSVICLDSRKVLLAEITVLINFFLVTVETTVKGVITFVFYKQIIMNPQDHAILDTIGSVTVFALAVILLTITSSTSQNCLFKAQLTGPKAATFLSFFSCVFAFGIIIGYTAIITTSDEIVLRLRVMIMTVAGIIGIIIFAFCVLLYVYKKQQEKLEESNLYSKECIIELTRQYELITTKNEQLRQVRHDQNAHLIVLRKIAESDNMKAFYQYVDELNSKYQDFDYISTGNIVGDAIINEWTEIAKKENITHKVAGKFPAHMNIAPIDLSSILYNAVKNAFESALRCSDGKLVEITIKSFKQRIFITIRNSNDTKLNRKGDYLMTSKVDKNSHGLGSKIMHEVVSNYSGKLEWNCDQTGYITTELEI